MKCETCKKILVLFLDNELPAEHAERVREHLAVCQACRAETELLASTLDLAVQRAHECTPPGLPPDFISRFWERARRPLARASNETRRFLPRESVWLFVRGIRARHAVAGASAMFILAFAIVALLRDSHVPPGTRIAKPSEQTGLQRGTPPPVDSLAEIEKRLAELEAAVQRVRSLSDTHISYTAEEMKEIYAAIGLAAANHYRNSLRMNDVAARKYAHVANTFPETTAGREAARILSRLN